MKSLITLERLDDISFVFINSRNFLQKVWSLAKVESKFLFCIAFLEKGK